MDIYYRSIPVAKQFLEKNITIFGLSKPNSKALPPAMKENKDRDEISWSSCSSNGLQLNSYIVTNKSSCLPNVLLSNTMNGAHFVAADNKMKPMVYKICDYTKGKIDIPNQRMGSYTTKSKTRRWTQLATYYVLDTSRVNVQTIGLANGKVVESSFGFGWNLCLALVKPLIESRWFDNKFGKVYPWNVRKTSLKTTYYSDIY